MQKKLHFSNFWFVKQEHLGKKVLSLCTNLSLGFGTMLNMDEDIKNKGLLIMHLTNLKTHENDESIHHTYFTKSDVQNIISVIKENYIHLIWFKFLYSFGMTLHELVNLKLEDIDFEKAKLNIRSSKKLAPRALDIPKSLLCDLRIQSCHKFPESFVFQGKTGKLNTRTIQKAMQKVEWRLNIKLTISKLRKSIAVHLLQNGWDYKEIGEFLGHTNYRATKNLLGPSAKSYKNVKLPIDEILQ